MIRLKEIRLKHHVSGLARAGEQVLTDKVAEMYLADGAVLIRTRKGEKSEDIIVPFMECEYGKPAGRLEGVFETVPLIPPVAAIATTDPGVNAQVSMPASTPPSARKIAAPASEDVIRFPKIGGKVVERKGPMLDDELEALTAPRKTVAQMIAEADGAEADE